MRRRAVAHVLTPSHARLHARLQALAEMVDSIRTRQCNEVRTSVLLKAVLGAEAADEAELTGDLGKWEEHCASVKHAPCNRAWHSLATPRGAQPPATPRGAQPPAIPHVAQPATPHVAQPAGAHVAQSAPLRGRWRTPFCAWGSTCRGTWTSCPASRPSSTACSVSTSTRRRHSMYHSALGRSVHGRSVHGRNASAIAVVHMVRTRFDVRAATQCIQGCNPVRPDCSPTHAGSPRARRLHPCTQAATHAPRLQPHAHSLQNPCTQAADPMHPGCNPHAPRLQPHARRLQPPCTQARCFAHFTSIFDELIRCLVITLMVT